MAGSYGESFYQTRKETPLPAFPPSALEVAGTGHGKDEPTAEAAANPIFPIPVTLTMIRRPEHRGKTDRSADHKGVHMHA
jgi:hypothetical protein